MAKVRWSTTCAGGCGTHLPSGTRATRLHGGWFCQPCFQAHKPTCLVFQSKQARYGGSYVQGDSTQQRTVGSGR